MKKLYITFIFLFLLSSCSFTKNTEFDKLIKNYPHNTKYISQYEEVYNQTNNIIYAINNVHYPKFLIPNSYNFLSFNSNNLLFVNTNFKLSKTYITKTLTNVINVDYIKRTNQTMQIDKETLNAYQELFAKSLEFNLQLTIFSAYRSYEYQESIYNKEGNDFVAAPGSSEHQTGCAIDIATKDRGLTNHFENTIEYEWLLKNAHLYGFILRYPKDKEHITGYPFEPWHYRYVGKDIAKIIYEQNITLEEYFYNNVII